MEAGGMRTPQLEGLKVGCTEERLERLHDFEVSCAAKVLASAFQDYPIWAYIQPREGLRVKLLKWVLKRYMRGILAKSKLRQGCVYAVRDGPGDSLAGVILLWRPSTAGTGSMELPPWQVVRQGLLALPFRFGAAVTHRLLQADSAEGQERRALEGTLGAYWYLDYLCVDTSLQSKGLGTRALAHCIRQAQAERDCPMLVNTCSEAARSFYLRNGFREVGAQPVLIGGRAHWWLAHPARAERGRAADA